METFNEDGLLNFTTKSNKLIYKNCYLYDIKSCSLEIIKKLGYNFLYNNLKDIDKDNRNKILGFLGKYNGKLIKDINYNIHTLMKYFIIENNIEEKDIIFIQKDGILTKKYITNKINQKNTITPVLRSVFSYIVFTEDKKSYMAKDEINKKIITKGIKNKSIGLDDFLTKYAYNYNLDDFSKINDIVCYFFKSKDKNLFAIENKQEKDKYDFIMNDSILTISKNIFDISDIDFSNLDMDFYFENYIVNFIRSMIVSLI